MTTSISVWLKDILPRTPGVVRAVAKRELLLAAREFYRVSTAWREVLDNYEFISDVYGYTVTTSNTDAEVFRIMAVEVDGLPLTGRTERPAGTRRTGGPTDWYATGTDTFDIWPTPEQYVDDVVVRVALIPTESATTLPFAEHYEPILDGVLGRLYSHPAKAYTNPELATYHMRRFRDGIAWARGEQTQGGKAGQNWYFPPFAK